MGHLIELNDAELAAYVASPAGTPRGGLVVIHEIWGLVDHIREVTDRFAGEGYLALAPDLLRGVGISPEVGEEVHRLVVSADDEERSRAQPTMREMMSTIRAPEFARWAVGALRRCVDYLAEQPEIGENLGVLGFCFGGSYSFALAAADPRIRAAVPFYGSPPAESDASLIACPVLAFYGDQDGRLMAGLRDVTSAMTAAEVDFTAQVYPGAGHAFFNDSNTVTYRADAATDAWSRTLSFLDRCLPSAPDR